MRRGLQIFRCQCRKITLAPVMLLVCLVLAVPQNGGGQTLQTVNMGIPSKSFQMVIYPLAQEKGYMHEEGIDLKVIYISPVTSIQAMLGGDVQFTGAGSSALVSIARANAPLKVVASTNDRVLQWLLTRPNISDPKELKGKRIATTGVASIATFMLKQILAKHGLDAGKDVIYLDPGTNNQLPALLAGTVDAAVLSVEARYVGLDKGMREMFFFGNEVKNSWGTLGTTDKLIKENPKLVSAYVRATIKALRYLRQDKEGAIAALIKFSGVSRQQASRLYDELIPTFTRNGAVDEEAQRNDLNIVRQVVNSNDTVPTAKAYDFSFALEADQQLNRAGWKP
ncbi:MAG: ABC transporter substrate-binding protein [Deltaproteobacteria bacterium]|nr:ABC transporter substrate-binding protein [Deltaproteobacteria bacterium]MDZ4341874.1 ABC transporter substrate-binding protein [Candidatus Binatia bacterium]